MWTRRVRWAVAAALAVAAAMAAVTLPRSPSATCPGGDVVATVDGVTLCTHGPDVEAAPSGAGAEAATVVPIRCVGGGTSGSRVQAVYARVAGAPDRYGTLRGRMVASAGGVEHIVARSAAQTGGERHVRWVTGPACGLTFARVTVPPSAVDDFGALVRSLDGQGLDRHDRKYLVWLDAPDTGCRGIATRLTDDRPGQENYNNTSVGYARVDNDCLNWAGRVEAHELLHLLGAVQRSAPHASTSGHCSDEWDRLCYDDDGAGSFRTTVRCASAGNDLRLDCNHDDYFSTAPPAGSYLATHWNAADSRFLQPGAPIPPPAPPGADFATAPLLPGYAGATEVTGPAWFKWRPKVTGPVAVNTRGSAPGTSVTVSVGASPTALVPVAPSGALVRFDAVEGTTYRIGVTGPGTVQLSWGAPPAGFNDVAPGAWYEPAVDWAVVMGVASGYSDRTWLGREAVTQGQVEAMLWHLLDEPGPAPARSREPVTRADFAAMVVAAIGEPAAAALPAGASDDLRNRNQVVSSLFTLAQTPTAWSAYPTPRPTPVVF